MRVLCYENKEEVLADFKELSGMQVTGDAVTFPKHKVTWTVRSPRSSAAPSRVDHPRARPEHTHARLTRAVPRD